VARTRKVQTREEKCPKLRSRGGLEAFLTHPASLCLIISVLALAIYGRTYEFQFIDLDDPFYITGNAQVLRGLTWEGLRWAFSGGSEYAYWHPVTWLSLMLDASLFKASAAGFHAMNTLLHTANALLVFLCILRMTGEKWTAFFVAFAFAVHPAHHEAVAWITARKDVLMLFFGLLALLGYFAWARDRRPAQLAGFLVFYALSLMSKPTLVVLPALLLCLDAWPLRRFDPYAEWGGLRRDGFGALWAGPLPRLVLEKLSALFLAAAVSAAVYMTHPRAFGLQTLDGWQRLSNALVSAVQYLGKVVAPVRLGIYYPFPGSLQLWQVGGAALFLAAILVLAVRLGRRHPWLLTCTAWFFLGLAPVIVPPKFGMHVALADRWLYFSDIGAFLALALGGRELLGRLELGAERRRVATALCALALCTWYLVLSLAAIGNWKDSESIYSQTLKVTEDNYFIESNYGTVLMHNGDLVGAEQHLRRSMALQPNYAISAGNLGLVYKVQGLHAEALALFERELKLEPDGFMAVYDWCNIGYCLAQLGRLSESEAAYIKALEIRPGHAEAHNDLGNIAWLRGDIRAAAARYAKAVELRPDYAVAQQNLARAQARLAGGG
jgi:Flp pilus assembly protein TadD